MNVTGQGSGLPKHVQSLNVKIHWAHPMAHPWRGKSPVMCSRARRWDRNHPSDTAVPCPQLEHLFMAQPFTLPKLPHHLCYRQRGTWRDELMKLRGSTGPSSFNQHIWGLHECEDHLKPFLLHHCHSLQQGAMQTVTISPLLFPCRHMYLSWVLHLSSGQNWELRNHLKRNY